MSDHAIKISDHFARRDGNLPRGNLFAACTIAAASKIWISITLASAASLSRSRSSLKIGSKLPSSRNVREEHGKKRRDMTGGVYGSLTTCTLEIFPHRSDLTSPRERAAAWSSVHIKQINIMC